MKTKFYKKIEKGSLIRIKKKKKTKELIVHFRILDYSLG